jgi:hypothetical protein
LKTDLETQELDELMSKLSVDPTIREKLTLHQNLETICILPSPRPALELQSILNDSLSIEPKEKNELEVN